MQHLFPDESRTLWNGTVEVHAFGTRHGDWALKSWGRTEAEGQNPGIAGRIQALVDQFGISRLFLPSPSKFNAVVASPEDFGHPWSDIILRGAYVEGVTLVKPGDACAIASGDCPTIAARDPKTGLVAAAHAGRESLYDSEELFNQAPSRPFTSVVDAIVSLLGKDLVAHVACGIAARNFLHPFDDFKHGGTNIRRSRHLRGRWGANCAPDSLDGRIDLHKLIAAQFRAHGITGRRVSRDRIDTHSEQVRGRRRWHSHRRDRTGTRNLVLVIRRK